MSNVVHLIAKTLVLLVIVGASLIVGTTGAQADTATPAPARCGSGVSRGTPAASPVAASGTPITDRRPLVDLEDFVAALNRAGLTVEARKSLGQQFLTADTATRLVVSGGTVAGPAEIQVYEYSAPGTMRLDFEQITPDGNLRTVMIE